MTRPKTTAEFIIDSIKVHGIDAYDYTDVKYKNNRTKVALTCCECKSKFTTRPTDHITKGYGCKACSKGKSERLAIELFKEITGLVMRAMDPSDVPWLKGLFLDGYCEMLGKKIALEYQGIQHSVYPNFFHKTKAEFKRQQENDKKKRLRCKKNDVILIRVPHTMSFKDREIMKTYIKMQLKKFDVIKN